MGDITKPIFNADKDWKRPKEVIPNKKKQRELKQQSHH